MIFYDVPLNAKDSLKKTNEDTLVLDNKTKRLIDLTSTNNRSQDVVEEILSIIQRKAPKLLDGLTDSNKSQISLQCQLKIYAKNEVVFNQGDEPDAYYTVIRGAVSIYALNSSLAISHSENNPGNDKRRSQYGIFIMQLPPGEVSLI